MRAHRHVYTHARVHAHTHTCARARTHTHTYTPGFSLRSRPVVGSFKSLSSIPFPPHPPHTLNWGGETLETFVKNACHTCSFSCFLFWGIHQVRTLRRGRGHSNSAHPIIKITIFPIENGTAERVSKKYQV